MTISRAEFPQPSICSSHSSMTLRWLAFTLDSQL